MESVISITILIIIIILPPILFNLKRKNTKIAKSKSINQNSYQRYAKFYDNTIPKDENFETKINKIYSLIVNDKKTDIKEIAKESGCTYDECILKIRYLKNKRKLGDYHIDHQYGELLKCTEEENALINKYKPFIYYNHYNIKEIAARLPGTTADNLKEVTEKVYEEILGLYKNDLINGIKINEVDKEIIYYTIEKSKVTDLISVECDNCGAINDVDRGIKTRCKYCNTIIEENKQK